MPVYDVYFIKEKEKANPFTKDPLKRQFIRGLKADSIEQLKKFFKQAKKDLPGEFKNLKIGEIKKVQD